MLNSPGKPGTSRVQKDRREIGIARTPARDRSYSAAHAKRRRALVVSGGVAVALTPVLALAASHAHNNGLVMGAIWLSFVAMVATVVFMWRRFARDMLASLRPTWEDWK
ncbi:hypothetical protein [Breoghania sp.]|uniref:hypothetical protein n=1 Tax=Breoghania sp. TaxID=2065378 RepID=UPI002AA68D98|nr:hypothetical protein [Breoghania sp.]